MNTKIASDKKQVTSNASHATSMAELLKSVKTPFTNLQKGEIIKGTITKLTPQEILIDIKAKTEAVVLEKDKRILRNLLSTLKVGDTVNVSILNPESDSGNTIVSLRRFIDDISWEKLKQKQDAQEVIKGIIREITKGGFVVETSLGISGFLPNSQTSSMENSQDVLNKQINVFILEMNRVDRKVILSQRPVISSEEFRNKTSGLKIGQKIDTIITTIIPFGLFVSLQNQENTLDGLIHISEIGWERTEDILEHFSIGQKLEAVVIRIDYEAKRVDLSLKRLTADPFEQLAKKYTIDQKIKATVAKVLPTGVSLTLEEGVEGFIRKEKIPPTVSYKIGQEIDATVTEVDTKRRRVILAPVLKEKPIGYR